MAKKPESISPEKEPSFDDMMRQNGFSDKQLEARANAGRERGKPLAAGWRSLTGGRKKRGGADSRQAFNGDHQTKIKARSKAGNAFDDSGSYKDCGCQNKRFQLLKRGKIKATRKCDLHGCTAEQARDELRLFLEQLAPQNKECALIICGKGLHSPDGKPTLKKTAMDFMRSHERVLAYCPALQKDGGHGAFYVLIRR